MAMRFDDDEDLDFNHEINVTPFIDVILVLLIIFMVAAPLATSNIAVQLPSSSQSVKPVPDKPIYITMQANHKLFIGDRQTSLNSLATDLEKQTKEKSKTRIFVRADKNTDYGNIMQLLGMLRKNGYLKVGLVGLAQE